MTNPVQILPSLSKENINISSPNPQLFKPVPIRKSENNLSFPISTKTNSPNSALIYPNFGFGSYSTFNFNSLGNLQNYLLSQEKKTKLDIKNKPCCNCIKTKCMKKYCECFANNKFCKNCVCIDCKNKNEEILTDNKENKENNSLSINKDSKAIFCTCSKSGCNKKYCDCYKENKRCNIKCRCINCLNAEECNEKSSNDNEKIISLDETRCDSGKKSLSCEINEFNVQKISVCIKKSQTYINIEKLSMDDLSLLCKKRKIEKI
jgi:hypothetical protein